jgi:hypothetical protein
MAMTMPVPAYGAGNAKFELRPHCENADQTKCPSFEVRDPENLQTPVYKPGGTIDIDLIIRNVDKKAVQRVRAWIAYDSTVLEGTEVAMNAKFPVPTPGENTFVPQEGYMKLSGTAQAPASDAVIVVARIRLKVLQPIYEATPLSFYDLTGTATSKTGIFEKTGAQENNILVSNPGYVLVRFETSSASSAAAVASSQATSAAQSSAATSAIAPVSSAAASIAVSSAMPASAPGSSIFTMLQVQNLRVTTEGSSVFLAWNTLPSSDLIGYNLYYGTTSGRYIQRRSLDASATNTTLRALPTGTTYYFAIRGVNNSGQETEFSQEVGISVGNPATSTSPLTGNVFSEPTPDTNGTVSGETGISSMLLLFLGVSAVCGTAFAFRRQWRTLSAHPIR